MAVFEYNGLTASGRKKSGIIDAENYDAAQDDLKQKGIFDFLIECLYGAGKLRG